MAGSQRPVVKVESTYSVVDRADERVGHLAELEAHEAAAGLEHAVGLGQRLVHVGHVADAEGDGVDVERVGLELQLLGVALGPGEEIAGLGQQPPGALLADLEHGRVDVADRDGRALAVVVLGRQQTLCDAEGDVARAAGHVQALERPDRVQLVDERVFPQAMHATAHKVVHDVVAVGAEGESASQA